MAGRVLLVLVCLGAVGNVVSNDSKQEAYNPIFLKIIFVSYFYRILKFLFSFSIIFFYRNAVHNLNCEIKGAKSYFCHAYNETFKATASGLREGGICETFLLCS